MKSQEELQTAANYLANNKGLRCALGIADEAFLQPAFLGAGEHNRNFVFCDPATRKKFVLRINVAPQSFHSNQVAYEAEALRVLGQTDRAPKVLYVDSSKRLLNYNALVISFCEGRMLHYDHLQEGDLERAVRIMADIHAAPIPANCMLTRPEDPLKSLFNECMQRFELYLGSPAQDERLTRWALRFIDAMRPRLELKHDHSHNCHIVNTEPLAAHFLLPHTPLGSHPGYFVDWERPIISDVAQDLAYFSAPTTTYWDSEYLMPMHKANELMELYWKTVDGRFEMGDFEERFKSWRMMAGLRSAMWCCKAIAQISLNPNTYITQKALDKLPVYLSDEFMDMVAKECFYL